ncbi:MAG: cell division protein FtsQ/DivIB [Burkholderiaceae bacterium]|nr:cell division protein FtsQ/DivIB [Sulfuritalea sp.]MCF8174471.1 cell division protein FtsQ/DivIB [Burkholderiaceae bacterium]MCF8185129.1 cell division protein FtsQ/DivIB [Polynucleobacter sp.]
MAKARGNTRNEPGGGDGFWDRPVLINLLADLLLLAAAVLLAWAGTLALRSLPVFPLKQLLVTTPIDRVSYGQIEHAARIALAGNFFTVNLDTAQSAFERLPWVRSASLRRIWPDAIELQLEEHRAVARWTPQEGEMRLVNASGEVFLASTTEALPQFAGPEGSASRVLSRYQEFEEGLASIGRRPIAVHLSARDAWQFKLDDGVVLELGREQPKHPLRDRLNRFTTHYATASNAAKSRLQTIGVVDMRYPNGFALRASKS